MSLCKRSKQNFENFNLRSLFSKKTQQLLTKFPGFATSRRHDSAMITDLRKFTTKQTLYGTSSFHFTVRINSKSFSGLNAAHMKPTPNFRDFIFM